MYAVRNRRSLGDVCAVMSNGTRVCSPAPLSAAPASRSYAIRTPAALADGRASTNYVRAKTGPLPINNNRWQAGGNGSNSQTGGMNLAQLQQLAQTNPAALTPGQYAALQAAGTIPSTVPYSSVSQLATATVPTATATDATTTTTGIDLSQTYAGVPLWAWLGGGAFALILIMKKK